MDYFVMKFMLLLTALSLVGALTFEECQRESTNCQVDLQAIQQPQQTLLLVCRDARNSLRCVHNLTCDSEMFMRIAYRETQRKLSSLGIEGCELGSNFRIMPGETAECLQQRESCIYSYVDELLDNDQNTTRRCQNLITFTSCELKLESCGVKRDQVAKSFDQESTRLVLPDCVSPYNGGTRITFSTMLWLSALLLVEAITH